MPPAVRDLLQGGRISPRRSQAPGGPGDGHRNQPGGLRGLGDQPRVLTFFAGGEVEPVIVNQVRVGHHAQRAGRDPGQVGQALQVGQVRVEQLAGQHPLGQVVDPAPPGTPHADDVAGIEQPLDRDLDVGPVPPRAAGLGPAQLGGGQRALGAQPGQHLFAGFLMALVPAHPAGPERPAAEGEVGPLLERQHAGRVGPVLEGGGLDRVPVGLLDLLPRNRAQPGVGHQLVRASQHTDRVQLYRANPAEHRRDPGPGRAPRRGAQEPLRPQRHAAGFLRGDRHLSRGSIQAHLPTLTAPPGISPARAFSRVYVIFVGNQDHLGAGAGQAVRV